MARNVEVKALDRRPGARLAAAIAAGAEDRGELRQVDTYFRVANGRLKLREQTGPAGSCSAELIHYVRPDAPDARLSAYRIAPVAEPALLKAVLAGALGVRGVVAKRRRLLVWRGVRVHLDEVDGLGHFVELEAVADDVSDPRREHALVRQLVALLAIDDADRLAGSYVDGLEEASEAG